MTPEAAAREQIDAQLHACGWIVQNNKAVDRRANGRFEHRQIEAEGERRLSMVEESKAVVTGNLQPAACLRQSVLQQAFSGNSGNSYVIL